MRKKAFPDMTELKNAFRDTPPEFAQGVEDTLRRLKEKEEQPKVKHKIPMALVFAIVAMLLMTGAAYAASQSHTLNWFRFFYGEDFLAGSNLKTETLNQSYELGDLIYTIDDVVLGEGALYGSGTIRAKEGANLVLISDEYEITDPAGYVLHLGDVDIPEDAPTYQGLAKERDARIFMTRVIPKGYYRNDTFYETSAGFYNGPGPDNTLEFTFELYVSTLDESAVIEMIEDQGKDAYIEKFNPDDKSITMSLGLGLWEVTQDGEWLREDPNDTWQRADWVVTVTPVEDKDVNK